MRSARESESRARAGAAAATVGRDPSHYDDHDGGVDDPGLDPGQAQAYRSTRAYSGIEIIAEGLRGLAVLR